ncbi:MAG: PSD1 and planctomycete cytochrome C domain-containing protein [Planctomycetaceae bacterium]
MSSTCLKSFLFLCVAFLPTPVLLFAADITPAQTEFFEKNVRPVLVSQCVDCHGKDEAESGLRVDSLAGLLKGGDRGPAIVPGKPEKSLLMSAINHGELLQMPPKDKLSRKQIADLTAWVKMGAPWPNAKPVTIGKVESVGPNFTKEEKAFWSFQTPKRPALPNVRNRKWVRTPIDTFILSRLEAQGLKPAPEADRRTLIRRLTFDLTGLPPTVEEIREFLSDKRPDAYERLVDRLLASPLYGERWGRHWLDVARYADSNGMDENLAFAHAFRYRDYVVNAFNQDKPFDQFVREQLAGDLLPAKPGETLAEKNERLIATGFLSIGPKMLADDDMVKKQMDIIDEQIDTVGKAFMGMTLGCARCHDHKFDPIRMSDYYSLAGILKSTKTMENFRVVAVWHEYTLASPEQQAKVKAEEAAIKKLDSEIKKLKKIKKRSAEQSNTLKRLERRRKQLQQTRTILPRAMGVTEGKPQNVRIHLRGSHISLGREVPRQMLQIIAGEQQKPIGNQESGRLQFARWLTSETHPLTSRVMINRIWAWHFGEGLVASRDNFGRLGERPTHPQLLDWLAREFIHRGWSMKAMHRLILQSSAYRMSTQFNSVAAEKDPKNRLYWRFNRRRMEAEEVRDSILALGGSLELEMGGQLMRDKNRAYVTGTGSKVSTYSFNRRSIYLPVLRSAVYNVFQAFDFADPSVLNGSRATTTVAPQALFMMNAELVSRNASELARSLLSKSAMNDESRIRTAFEQTLGRVPSRGEIDRFLAFLASTESEFRAEGLKPEQARQKAWRSVCRVLISSNEFIYIE